MVESGGFWEWRDLISIRTFAWPHLFSLLRYRAQVLPLDYELFLAHGSQTTLPAMLTSMNLSRGVYMSVYRSENGVPDLIGQMRYTPGERSARLAFIAPEPDCDNPSLNALVEYFAGLAGRQGAFHLLAELEEHHPALAYMRRSGFSVFAWQRIWKFPAEIARGNVPSLWKPARNGDEIAVRSLYHALVPPLVQAAEPFTNRMNKGLVYRHENEVLAHVAGVYGPRGIYLYPLIHPGVENVAEILTDLLHQLPSRMGRPLYLSVRSYQTWLESSLQQLNGETLPRQALLVKHLVQAQRVEVPARLGVLENRQAEPTATMVTQLRLQPPEGEPRE